MFFKKVKKFTESIERLLSMLINQFVLPAFCLCFALTGINFRFWRVLWRKYVWTKQNPWQDQIDLLTICYVVLKYNFIYLFNSLIESSGSTKIRVKDKEIIHEIQKLLYFYPDTKLKFDDHLHSLSRAAYFMNIGY